VARPAYRRGIRAFTGTIAGDNRPAALLMRSAAPGVRARWATGELQFEIPLDG
jgi:hypothetical protein